MTLGMKSAVVAAVCLTAATAAKADVIASLSFDTPNATVSSTASIPVWVTLTLDPTSDPLATDAGGTVTSPLSAQNLIDLVPGDGRIIVNNGFQCSGTFTSGCGAGAYGFNFNFGAPSFVDPPNLNLAPGSSTHWLFGTFTPTGGSALPGTYTFYNAIFEFEHYNPTDNSFHFSSIAQTCASQTADCAFTRTVVGGVVPEPAGWVLMLVGVGGLGAALRRRRSAPALA